LNVSRIWLIACMEKKVRQLCEYSGGGGCTRFQLRLPGHLDYRENGVTTNRAHSG
jgi:hypothetical protein